MLKPLLKRVIPERGIWYLADLLEGFKFFAIKLQKNNSLFVAASLFFSKNYIREHQAFLEGAFIYEKSRRTNGVNVHFLRRNIHRIEKGMIMRPRREEFAIRFVFQTTIAFKALLEDSKRTNDFSASEIEWSYQVLRKYFEIVNSQHPNYQNAKQVFDSLEFGEPGGEACVRVPFLNEQRMINVNYGDFLELNKKRKSVRWFSDQHVPSDTIEKALAVAAQTPSSCNRLPYRYFISNADKDLTSRIAKISPGTVGWYENIPAIAVLVGRQRAFSNVVNRHSIYVDGCLSVMPFVLALETMGLATCLINWADIPSNEDEMSSLLGLSKDEKVIVSIAIGFPEAQGFVAYSQRKSTTEISKFI